MSWKYRICTLLNVPGLGENTCRYHWPFTSRLPNKRGVHQGWYQATIISVSLVCVNFYIRSYMQHMRPTIHQKTCGPSQLRYYTFTILHSKYPIAKTCFLTGSQPVHSVRCLSHQQTSRRDVWFESRCQQHGNGALHDGPVGLCHGLEWFRL